jgi:hypothetical protein
VRDRCGAISGVVERVATGAKEAFTGSEAIGPGHHPDGGERAREHPAGWGTGAPRRRGSFSPTAARDARMTRLPPSGGRRETGVPMRGDAMKTLGTLVLLTVLARRM